MPLTDRIDRCIHKQRDIFVNSILADTLLFDLFHFSVEIFCDTVHGEFAVSSTAGNGHIGQNGGDGRRGSDASDVNIHKTIAFNCNAMTLHFFQYTLAKPLV